MVQILLYILLQLGSSSYEYNFEDVVKYMFDTKIERYTFTIGKGGHAGENTDIINIDSLKSKINYCFRTTNYDRLNSIVSIKLKQFKENYSQDVALTTIAIGDFSHDGKYAQTVFAIVKTTDNNHGFIWYISTKDRPKFDSLSTGDMELTEKFCNRNNGLSIISYKNPRSYLYIKTINYKTMDTTEAYFNGVTTFDYKEITSKNKSLFRLHEVIRLYNEYYAFLQDRTSRLRCFSLD